MSIRPQFAEFDFAVEAVLEAAALCQAVQKNTARENLTKEDKSPVTIADFASQALVAHRLERAFPRESLIAEEGSDLLRQPEQAEVRQAVVDFVATRIPETTPDSVNRWIDRGLAEVSGRFWVLDPIDGTRGYLRGDQYVVALALIEDGLVKVAAIGCPNLNSNLEPEFGGSGTVVAAAVGEGTWAWGSQANAWRRLAVSDTAATTQARMLRSVESGHTNERKLADLQAALAIEEPAIGMDSQAKYVVLAGGSGEYIFRLLSQARPDYREKIWDQAAGSLVVEEAGGRITDLRGQKLDFSTGRELLNNYGVLASNGVLHEQALAALRSTGVI